MRNEPLVSVIIPMYNAQDYIEITLQSVKSQTYENIELIIIDNASTDNSLSIVNSLLESFNNVKVIKCEDNSGGPARPRNMGIDIAKGEYLAFLDSDDIWTSNKLEVQIKHMLKHELNFTSTGRRLIDQTGQHITRKRDIKIFTKKSKTYGLKALLFKNTVVTSSTVIKKSLLQELRFDESSNLTCVEDYLLWLTLFNQKSCKFEELSCYLLDYRLITNSLSHVDGRYLLFAKSLLASCTFLIENKKQSLLLYTLLSNTVRLISFSLLIRK
jgi:teichuronic acid biosynthesis glycosyltransferase TuaG